MNAEREMRKAGLSAGIGLTNECNLTCAHCYRSTNSIHRLTIEDIKSICRHLSVGSIGFGTGESALHPEFPRIIEYLKPQGIKLTMASNGHSLRVLSDECLTAFHDVEVSVDFPTEREQDLFRGLGNWREVKTAMDRCRALGIEVSVLTTMMNTNFDRIDEIARLARSWGVNLRVNAYQSVKTDSFHLSYEQFWESYCRLFGASRLVSCSEPVVKAVLGLGPAVSPCGHQSVRFTPDGLIIPCVYWPGRSLGLDKLPELGTSILDTPEFEASRRVPASAKDCLCQGGCASRRALSGNLDRHDEYCPWVRGDEIRLDVEPASSKDLPRGSHVCTTIVA